MKSARTYTQVHFTRPQTIDNTKGYVPSRHIPLSCPQLLSGSRHLIRFAKPVSWIAERGSLRFFLSERDPVSFQILVLVRLVLGAFVYAARVQDRPAACLVRVEAGDEHFFQSL